MEILIWASGKEIRPMERVLILPLMALSISEIGLMINSMGWNRKLGPIRSFTLANTNMARSTARASSFGLIQALMKAIFSIIILRELVFIYGKTKESIKELGRIIKCMDLGPLRGPTVANT